MRPTDELPGRWVELRLAPVLVGTGLGPALGWLAGTLASGSTFWTWPQLGQLLLGLFLTTAIWGRLWTLFAQQDGPTLTKALGREQHPSRPQPALRRTLPYTTPGSLSAEWAAALQRMRRDLKPVLQKHRAWLIEVLVLGGVLLVVAGTWGRESFLAGLAGLALLGLCLLVRERPAASTLLRVLGGMAWPWWLGHTAWRPLTANSLLLSLFWGLAYTGWADLARETSAAEQAGTVSGPNAPLIQRSLLLVGLAQGAVLVFFLLSGQILVSGILAFTLLAQVLIQAGLLRTRRWTALTRRIWPFAAAGLLLSGLALGIPLL